MRRPDWLIVGAGFTGATVARLLAERRPCRVLVVDRRTELGGNAADGHDKHGILIHHFGPHIFHTNSEKVWRFLGRFTAWRPYEHRVRVDVGGQLLPLPVNLETIRALLEPDVAAAAIEALLTTFGAGARVPMLRLLRSDDCHLVALGERIYETIFLPYTLKQWERRPEDLDASVTARVPVLVGTDDRYFHDRFQAMPAEGYNALFRALLDHPGIETVLATSYQALPNVIRDAPTVFTGAVDELLDYRHGPLAYRSLRFEYETLPIAKAQEVATINHPAHPSMTRVTEIRHITGQPAASTTLMREYPEAHVIGVNEPYYPVPAPDTAALFDRYRQAVDKLSGRVWLAGRLGDYQYYNMDQACARAMTLVEKELP